MQIWDRLCQLLRMRQISVEDVSNKVNKRLCLNVVPSLHVLLRQLPWPSTISFDVTNTTLSHAALKEMQGNSRLLQSLGCEA